MGSSIDRVSIEIGLAIRSRSDPSARDQCSRPDEDARLRVTRSSFINYELYIRRLNLIIVPLWDTDGIIIRGYVTTCGALRRHVFRLLM